MAVPAAISEDHGQVNSIVEHPPVIMRPSLALNSSSDSDEQGVHPIDAAKEDETDEVVGVSIGRAQSRMKARLTPAEEKTRIMGHNGSYFDPIPDVVESDGLFLSEVTAEPESLSESPKSDSNHAPDASEQNGVHAEGVPSTREGSWSNFTRSILKSSLARPRSRSGDTIANLRLKKFLPDFGSLTKRSSLSSLSFLSNSSHYRSRSQTMKSLSSKLALGLDQESEPQRRRSYSVSDPKRSPVEEPISDLKPLNGSTTVRHSFSRRPTAGSGATGSLMRSSSDQSLYLRASSTASSLDNRPQYENVHSQVNSRFKAIKDTLQDQSRSFLSRPTLHLQDFRGDWGYRPPFMSDVGKGNSNADEPQSAREVPKERTSQPRVRADSSTLRSELSEAMSELTGDVVIMGGYRGSILRSAKPPHRQLWVPMKVGLNLRKVDLEVGLNPEDEERMEETIIPSGVLSHIGPVDICRRLMKRLQKCENSVNGELRVWNYGYDWRLSPHLLSKKLIKFLEDLPCNAPGVSPEKRGAYVIAHSLGGLITRHVVNERPELFSGVLYAGVPQHCVNILGPLRHGDDVLLSSRVLTAQVNFSFRTSFALLPEDGHCFIDKHTKEEYPVDYFSAKAWDEYRLTPVINPALPSMTSRAFKDNFPNLGKRLSTVLGRDNLLSDDAADFGPKEIADEDPRQNYIPREDVRSSPRSANPVSNVADKASAMAPTMDGVVGPTANLRGSANVKATTATTIPRATAMAYLERILPEIRQFKQELAFNSTHQSENKYPPFAVLYGKSVPTVYGVWVGSREQIKHQDAYDDLAFAAGDGVCLASAAMLPPGYRIIKDGLVKSDRGHVGLLGDLEGVGQCLRALVRGRREGVGLGTF